MRPFSPYLLLLWVVFSIRTSAEPPLCAQDEALGEAASMLLLDGGSITPEALEAAVREAHSDLVGVRSLVVREDAEGRVRAWLSGRRDAREGPLVCGEATGSGRRVVLAARRGGRLGVHTDERSVSVALHEGFDRPELVVQDADGRHRRIDVSEASAPVALPREVALPALVQLVAHGPAGPRPVAERWIGAPSGSARTMVAGDPGANGAWDRRLQDLREAYGAGTLRPNRLLAKEAESHARQICKHDRVGHELEQGADPEARLARRRLRARVVGEAIARAEDPDRAFEAMAKSPSHLLTLIDRRFTDAGWGSASDSEGRSCAVVLLAAWPRVF